LATRTSIGPSSRSTRSRIASISSNRVTSATTCIAWSPVRVMAPEEFHTPPAGLLGLRRKDLEALARALEKL
jgi:hypothetical protein